MPSNWTKLADDVQDLVAFFSASEDIYLHPFSPGIDKSKLINEIKKENWNKVKTYSFFVVDKDDAAVFYEGTEWSEFKLTINPLELTQDENFAVNITATQDGVVSEHNGIVFRDLVISGTTGLHPSRGTGGADRKGKVIGGAPNKQKNRTGYEEFLQLRNYLRAYALMKKDPTSEDSRGAVLTFINRKDNERLIVEPIKFTMKRSTAKGPLYDYSIVLKVIGNMSPIEDKKVSGIFATIDEVSDSINDFVETGRKILLKSAGLLRQFEREINNTFFEPLRQFDLFIKTGAGLVQSIGNMGKNLVSQFKSSLTVNLLVKLKEDKEEAIANGATGAGAILAGATIPTNIEVAALKGGQAILDLGDDVLVDADLDETLLPVGIANSFTQEKNNSQNLTKNFFKELAVETVRIRDNVAEAFGLGDETYNAFANRAVTFTPSPTKQITTEEQEILFAFARIIQALNLTIAYGGDKFEKNLETTFAEKEIDFNNLVNLPVPSSVKEVIIAPGQSLEDIAFVNYRDWNRWVEIAVLNNLIPPYITDDPEEAGERIKIAGDRIIIPSDGSQVDTNVVISGENRFNSDLSETEKRLGIDFKLTDQFDLAFNNRSDIELIRGGQNAGQAIKIKMNLEKGDLRLHPRTGLGLIIGEKVTDADGLFDSITNTILADPRFSSIRDFSLQVQGNTVIIDLNLFVTESETPVPISLNL